MWDKQFDKASWNGLAFHLLKTNEEHGKRLYVPELPYKDDPHIWVMGGKAVGYQFSAVFVGANYIADAQAFRKKLDDEPAGTLEHPYLGELQLVYESSSIEHVSTKKGLVSVSLKFIKQGDLTVVPERTTHNISSLTAPVVTASTDKFITKVEKASPSQIDSLKQEITGVINKIKMISSQMNKPGNDVTGLIKEISATESALSSLANSPSSVAGQLNNTMISLTSTVNSSDQSSSYINLNSAHFANEQLEKSEQESTNEHLKLITTIASIDTSSVIQELSNQASIPANLNYSEQELNNLVTRLNDRKKEATAEATHESYELVFSVDDLLAALSRYQAQINSIKQNLIEVEIFSPAPDLYIAHQNECSTEELTSLNSYAHPLFVSGKVKVLND